ncbi:MAG: hypothetical protein OEZ36_07215, partial [Spirochaetota bacterium]|nr:hypothetical protein [Spirochaetota bacterium]
MLALVYDDNKARITSLEDRARQIAREIYDATKQETPSFFDSGRWKGRIMDWAMRDDKFRVRLLHFIDVLPVLKEDSTVVRILKEYFTGDVNTPKLIHWAIR